MLGQVRQMIAMAKSVQNPQAMLQQIVNQNPIVQQTIQQYGSVENAVSALCQQRGIDPQEIMNMLK